MTHKEGLSDRRVLVNVKTRPTNCATNSCLLMQSCMMAPQTESTCLSLSCMAAERLRGVCQGLAAGCGAYGSCSDGAKWCVTLTHRQWGYDDDCWCWDLLLA